MDLETYQGHGLHLVFKDEYPNKTVNGRTNSEILDALDTSGGARYTHTGGPSQGTSERRQERKQYAHNMM